MRSLGGGALARKRALGALTGLTVSMLGVAFWLAAPALSLRAYVPEPVEFELRDRPLPLHSSAAVTSSGTRVLGSRVLEAPKRFNLVGLRWKGARSASLTVRVRRAGDRWGRWVSVPVDRDDAPDVRSRERRRGWAISDPVWAGEADQVQYRIAAAAPVRQLRLHFVNSKGTATRADRLRTGVRRAVGGVVGTVASLFGASAGAATSQPEIVTRDQWGGGACRPRAIPEYGEVKLAFIHHTVTANDYGPGDSAAMVLGICRYHRNSNGWNDIGYQFLVDRYGKIFEGRGGGIDQAVVGAQAQGYNSQSTGIASLGTFSTEGQTREGLGALARLLSWKLAVHAVPTSGTVAIRSAGGGLNRYPAGAQAVFNRISGHRDADKTACPGDGLYSQLPLLRTMVTTDTRTPTAVSLSATRGNIPYGRKARLSGKLRAADGSALAAQQVEIRTLGGASRLGVLARAATGSSGSYATSFRLAFNRTVAADFAGNPTLRPARSRPLRIGVRPRVTAALHSVTESRPDTGQRLQVSGSVRPRKRSALLLIDRQKADGTYRRVEAKRARVRFGRIRASHRFSRPGRYRVRLGVERDTRNLSARSEPLTVKVD
jgi:hypothetical protein